MKKLFLNEFNLVFNKKSVLILITKENKEDSLENVRSVILSSEEKVYKNLADRFFFYNPLDSSEKKEGILDKKEFIEILKNMDFLKEKFFQVLFNKHQDSCIDIIFKFVKNEITLYSEINEIEELIKSLEKLDVFQNSKNPFIINRFGDIYSILYPSIVILLDLCGKFCDLNIFESCEVILETLYKILKRNKDSEDSDIFKKSKNLEKIYTDKKKKFEISKFENKKLLERNENESEEYKREILIKLNNLDKKSGVSIIELLSENLKKSREIFKTKIEKEIEEIDKEIKKSKEKKKLERVKQYVIFKEKKISYKINHLKNLEKTYKNKINQIDQEVFWTSLFYIFFK